MIPSWKESGGPVPRVTSGKMKFQAACQVSLILIIAQESVTNVGLAGSVMAMLDVTVNSLNDGAAT
jgi:hypothetical protein